MPKAIKEETDTGGLVPIISARVSWLILQRPGSALIDVRSWPSEAAAGQTTHVTRHEIQHNESHCQ
jgi:hypothetical protein